MGEEVKEVLEEYLNSIISYPFQKKDKKYILDYITNLQQKYEKLKNRNDFLEKVCVGFDDKYEYIKSINKKAIEYNAQVIKDTKDFYRPTSDVIYSGDTLIDIATQNINILNGGENNVKD